MVYSIDYWIDKRALITPERTALIDEVRRYTYLQLSRVVNKLARFLKEEVGLRKGERLAVLSQNRAEYVITIFAAAKLGLIIVPLNIRLSISELSYQVQDSSARVLLTEEGYLDQAQALMHNTSLAQLINMDSISFKNSLTSYSSAVFVEEHVSVQDRLIICYTSGTTGRPKGAVLTQENMFWNAINGMTAIDLTAADRSITLLPMFHIGGIGLFTLPTLFSGGTVVLPRKFEAAKVLNLIEKEQVTVVMGVPTMHDALRKSGHFQQTNLSSVRLFYSGGAPCPIELIDFYLDQGIAFGQGYGLTETAPTVFMLAPEDYSRRKGSIGKPALFTDVRIVDEAGQDVPHGEVGEIIIKGPNVFSEYWNLVDETNQALKESWFYTGDLAKQDEEQFVYIIGRKKEMIISGGENVYPLEVENVILGFRGVAEVAVIGIADDYWGEVPVAVLTAKEGVNIVVEELVQYCEERLAKYKVPKHIQIVSTLPLNAAGKINKSKIKQELSKEYTEYSME